MTQDKELLLKDLCARLPYDVKVSYHIETNSTICGDYEELNAEGISDISSYKKFNLFIVDGYVASIENIKPYLFPLSSMTEKQNDSWRDAWFPDLMTSTDINYPESEKYLVLSHAKSLQWLYENHFDVNGLIEKGLALDATGKNIY